MKKQTIVESNRCIINGTLVLMGYNSDGKEVFRMPIRNSVSSRKDLTTIRKAHDEWHEAAKAEAATTN